MIQRFDVGSLDSVEKTPQGGLRVDAYLTRAGVFHYDDGKGGTIAEYRPLEEVSHADSLATLEDAPFTVGHVGLVSPDNHSANAAGHVRNQRMDGERVAATVVVQGRKAIRAIEKGTRQVSCGYTCKLDEIPGTAPNGERYDRIQRGIRYNHVALVDRGRAGDDVRLRLDAAGNQSTGGEPSMEFERIDGTKYEVDSEPHRAAVQRRDEANKLRAGELSALQAKFDAANADKATLATELAELKDPARMDAAVTARAALVDGARKVLGAEVKFDGQSDLQIKAAVVAKVYPALRCDSADAIRVGTLFEAAMASTAALAERADAEKAGNAALATALVTPLHQDAKEITDPADKARFDMAARNRDAWKQTPNASTAK